MDTKDSNTAQIHEKTVLVNDMLQPIGARPNEKPVLWWDKPHSTTELASLFPNSHDVQDFLD
jgi:hypothetical protein